MKKITDLGGRIEVGDDMMTYFVPGDDTIHQPGNDYDLKLQQL